MGPYAEAPSFCFTLHRKMKGRHFTGHCTLDISGPWQLLQCSFVLCVCRTWSVLNRYDLQVTVLGLFLVSGYSSFRGGMLHQCCDIQNLPPSSYQSLSITSAIFAFLSLSSMASTCAFVSVMELLILSTIFITYLCTVLQVCYFDALCVGVDLAGLDVWM